MESFFAKNFFSQKFCKKFFAKNSVQKMQKKCSTGFWRVLSHNFANLAIFASKNCQFGDLVVASPIWDPKFNNLVIYCPLIAKLADFRSILTRTLKPPHFYPQNSMASVITIRGFTLFTFLFFVRFLVDNICIAPIYSKNSLRKSFAFFAFFAKNSVSFSLFCKK